MKRFLKSMFSNNQVEATLTFFPYGNDNIPLKYKPNSRAKRLTLRISTKDKSLVLTIPPKTNPFDIQAFLRRCIPWVEKHYSKHSQTLSIVPGVNVNLNGVAYTCVTDPLRRRPTLCKVSKP